MADEHHTLTKYTPSASPEAPVFVHLPASRLRRPESLPACVQADADAIDRARRLGQIRPVPADADDGIVWGGLDEYLALTAAGLPEIACRLLPEDAAARFALLIHHDGEALNKSPILRAWLVSAMLSTLEDAALLPLLPPLGLPRRREAALECAALLRLPESVQAALHEGALLPRSLPPLRRLPEDEQEALVGLIRRYRLGGSKQQQLADWTLELRLRENIGLAALLSEWRACDPPTDNPPQEAQHLLAFLSRRLNPGLDRAEADFQAKARALQSRALKAGVQADLRFEHTRSFEDDRVSVAISFADWSRLERCWPGLLALLAAPAAGEDDVSAENKKIRQ